MSVKFIHQNPTTFACEVDDSGNVVAYAKAKANTKHDQFCRETGRVKSAGRLKSTHFMCMPQGQVSFKDFCVSVRQGEMG